MVVIRRFVSLLSMLLIVSSCGQKFTIIRAHPGEIRQERPSGRDSATAGWLLNRSIGQYRRGELDSARTGLVDALQTDSSDWRINYYLGLIYQDRLNYDEAISSFDRALLCTPDDKKVRSQIYLSAGENWEKLGQLPKAEQHYITALNLNPDLAPAAEALKRIGRLRAEKE